MFYKQTEIFVKIISKLGFTDLTRFTRKLDLDPNVYFEHVFRDITTAWCFEAGRCQILHLQWRVCKLGLTGLS